METIISICVSALGALLTVLCTQYFTHHQRMVEIGCQNLQRVPRGYQNTSPQEVYEDIGKTFVKAKIMFGPTIISTVDPLNIQAIYLSNFKDYGVSPLRLFAFSPLIGSGAMDTDGVLWEHSRALLRPVFARSQNEDLALMEPHVQNLISCITENTPDSTIDLQPLFACMDLDISTEFIFGESAGSMTKSSTVDARAFLNSYNTAQKGIAVRLGMMLQWEFLHRDKMFWKSCKTVHDFVDRAVDEAITQRNRVSKAVGHRHVLAYDLVGQSDDRVKIRDALMNVFLPGHDTTAILLSNMFFALARHPAVYDTLRQEVLAIDSIAVDSLKRCSYLQFVINETLRLWPPVRDMARIALENTVLPRGGGATGSSRVYIAKGDILISNYYCLHRSRDIWGGDADSFRPERWDGLKAQPWTFMAFSNGPRVCPGQQRALNEAAFVAAKLVKAFSSIENKDPVWEYRGDHKLVVESANGVQVALQRA